MNSWAPWIYPRRLSLLFMITIFFDLDRVLYNTSAHLEEINNFLIARGYERHNIEEARLKLHHHGYSFEEHLKLLGEPLANIEATTSEIQKFAFNDQRHIFPGVVNGLQELRAQGITLHLLTFGLPKYQQGKWVGLQALHPYFDQTFFVHQGDSKGQILARETSSDQQVFFIDDSPAWLLDSLNYAPWVQRIRLMWPQCQQIVHPADNELWTTVSNFEELCSQIALCSEIN